MGDSRRSWNPMLSAALGCCSLLALLVVCRGTLAAQSLGDSIAAAANGSVAGAAGKPLSDGISKIFGKVAEQQKEATLEERRPRQEILMPAEEAPDSAPATQATTNRSSSRQSTRRPTAAGREAYGVSQLAEVHMRATQPSIQTADLAAITIGTPRSELSNRLGRPSARVFIPGDGELLEVHLFSSGGKHVGRVELADGEVTAINTEP